MGVVWSEPDYVVLAFRAPAVGSNSSIRDIPGKQRSEETI